MCAIEDLAEIEGFDDDVATELQERARAVARAPRRANTRSATASSASPTSSPRSKG